MFVWSIVLHCRVWCLGLRQTVVEERYFLARHHFEAILAVFAGGRLRLILFLLLNLRFLSQATRFSFVWRPRLVFFVRVGGEWAGLLGLLLLQPRIGRRVHICWFQFFNLGGGRLWDRLESLVVVLGEESDVAHFKGA